MNFILEEMDAIDADGVDFIQIWFGPSPPPIIKSMTREEVINADGYPKSSRLYWRIINGKRHYINPMDELKNLF